MRNTKTCLAITFSLSALISFAAFAKQPTEQELKAIKWDFYPIILNKGPTLTRCTSYCVKKVDELIKEGTLDPDAKGAAVNIGKLPPARQFCMTKCFCAGPKDGYMYKKYMCAETKRLEKKSTSGSRCIWWNPLTWWNCLFG